MVNLDMDQQKALSIVERVAQQRHALKLVEREEVRKARERVKARVYADFDAEMSEAVTLAKNLGVPDRRIGLAWGSTSPNTGGDLVRKYWKSDKNPDYRNAQKNEMFEDGEEN